MLSIFYATEEETNIDISIVEQNEELESARIKIEEVSKTIENLFLVRDNIKRFGITKELLHLVDDNKQLSNSLKINLEDEFSSGDTAISSVTGGIKAAIEWLKNLFLALGKGIKNFFKFLFNTTEELKATFQKSIDYLNANKGMDNSYLLKKVKVTEYKLDTLITIGEDINEAINTLLNIKIDNDSKNSPLFIKDNSTKDKVNNGLKYLGQEIKENSLQSDNTFLEELSKEKKEDTLHNLDYTPNKMLGKKANIEKFFKTLEDSDKYEKKFKEHQDTAIKDLNDRKELEKKDKKSIAKEIGTTISKLTAIIEKLLKALLKVIRMYCNLCMKMPKDKDGEKTERKGKVNAF